MRAMAEQEVALTKVCQLWSVAVVAFVVAVVVLVWFQIVFVVVVVSVVVSGSLAAMTDWGLDGRRS